MPDECHRTASLAYATLQLQRAMASAAELGDVAGRVRAQQKMRSWQTVVSGMASGQLSVGTRAPVADTPAWVTLEVVHGGFATGRCLAESPLTEDEAALAAALPSEVPGTNDRERLNLWFLSDDGQAQLREVLHSGRYRVEVPEEAALAAVVLLLDNGFPEQALDLVAELRPLMHRLRFTVRFEGARRPSGATVRVASAAETAQSLRAAKVPPQLAAMRATLGVWNPLYERLIALWSMTVAGELPHLDEAGAVQGAGLANSGRHHGRSTGNAGSMTSNRPAARMNSRVATRIHGATSQGCTALCSTAPLVVKHLPSRKSDGFAGLLRTRSPDMGCQVREIVTLCGQVSA
ncbi:hypothetical protein R2360_16895 [Mycobacteroides chelonae]|nr:hypothetical protein [Mycobacteroides chelonae]